jgi:catechol 2,3-dioxygenase-like lactoylglutathione lyase family enzyme
VACSASSWRRGPTSGFRALAAGRRRAGAPDRGPGRLRRRHAAGRAQSRGRHAAFGIDDYETALAKLAQHDLDVLAFGAPSGQMWVRDPDGNIIELIAGRR